MARLWKIGPRRTLSNPAASPGTFTQTSVTLTRIAGGGATTRSKNVVPLPPGVLPGNDLSYFRVLDPANGNAEVACYAELVVGTHEDRTSPNGVYVEVETDRSLNQTKTYLVDFTAPSAVARLTKAGWSERGTFTITPDSTDNRFFKLNDDVWLPNVETGVMYHVPAQRIPWPTGSDITATAVDYNRRSFRVEVDLTAGTISLVPGSTSTNASGTSQISNSPVSGHNDGNRYALAHIGVAVAANSSGFQAGTTSLTASHVALPSHRRYQSMLPEAVLLPTDPEYLVACDVVGPTLTWDETQALGGTVPSMENEAYAATVEHFTRFSTYWVYQAAAVYGAGATVYYGYYVRTGELKHWLCGRITTGANIQRVGLAPSEPEWDASIIEYVIDYLMTGNPDDLTIVNSWVGGYPADNVVRGDWSQRSHARIYEHIAWVNGRLGQGKATQGWSAYASASAALDAGLTFLEAHCSVAGQEGRYPSTDYCPANSADGRGAHVLFGAGYVLIRLHDCYRYFASEAQKARIVALAHLIDAYSQTQFEPSVETYYYQDLNPCTGNSTEADHWDLNMMVACVTAWRYHLTGDTSLLARVQEAVSGARNAYFQGEKQNQEYNSFAGYAFYYMTQTPAA